MNDPQDNALGGDSADDVGRENAKELDQTAAAKVDRETAARLVFERLFGVPVPDADEDDHELMEILRNVIFGDVFAVGNLDDRTRELITVTALATLQTLPQLKAHMGAAYRVGVTPIELREAVYQLAPFIGFPRTLNALRVLNEVLEGLGATLPLPGTATVASGTRHERGLSIQTELYGTEIADALADLPAPFNAAVPNFLTDMLFGDFWTRGGLETATRELLALVTLAALNLGPQLPAHVRGAKLAGNSEETILAALVQAFPYIGFPSSLNAIREVLAARKADS